MSVQNPGAEKLQMGNLEGPGDSFRGAKGSLDWFCPIQIPSKCWGWSNLPRTLVHSPLLLLLCHFASSAMAKFIYVLTTRPYRSTPGKLSTNLLASIFHFFNKGILKSTLEYFFRAGVYFSVHSLASMQPGKAIFTLCFSVLPPWLYTAPLAVLCSALWGTVLCTALHCTALLGHCAQYGPSGQVIVLSSLRTVSTSLPAINWDHRLGVLKPTPRLAPSAHI